MARVAGKSPQWQEKRDAERAQHAAEALVALAVIKRNPQAYASLQSLVEQLRPLMKAAQ